MDRQLFLDHGIKFSTKSIQNPQHRAKKRRSGPVALLANIAELQRGRHAFHCLF